MKKLLILLTVLSIIACGNNQSGKKKDSNPILTDSIINILCKANQTNTYWIYKPKGADDKTPIVVFFDPHGDGKLPIVKYKAIANSLNMIFIGSNSSKNGMNMDELDYAVQTLFTDINSRFNLSQRSVFLCGFSGGARAAGSLAMSSSMIKGVVAIGASIRLSDNIPNKNAIFIEIAGIRDFNYTELYLNQKKINSQTIHYSFIPFDGKHEWAPESFVYLAMLHFENSLQTNTPKMCSIIDTLITKHNNDITLKHDYLLLGANINTQVYSEKYTSFTNAPSTKIYYNGYDQNLQQEINDQQALVNSFKKKDLAWWTLEIKRLQKAQQSNNLLDARHNARLLNFASMLGYMYTNGALVQGNKKLAKQYLSIYKAIDPENSDVKKFEEYLSKNQ